MVIALQQLRRDLRRMDWCDAALRTASESVSQVARCVSFANAVHSSLNDAPHAKQRRAQLRRFIDGLVDGTSDALGQVLVQLPSLLSIDADEFRLPSVLIAAHFATQPSFDYDGAMYGCFSWRLRQVITRIGIVRDLGLDTSRSDAPGVEALRASLRVAADTAVPLEASQSPAAGVLTGLVVLGPNPMSVVDSDTAASNAFKAMVAAVDRGMLACTAESGTGTRLMHHLERFAEDAHALLVTCIAGGDRVPLISGFRASVLESMRAYIHTASCCALERDCARSEAAAAVLIGMAHYGCADLLASDVNSTHAPLGDQNPAHWAVLRATLSGDRDDEANEIAHILQTADVEHPGTLAVASALCGMMRTRMGMMIFCNDPGAEGEFPTASRACAVASERRGRTVLDAVIGSTTGTLDMTQCAAPARMDDSMHRMDEMTPQLGQLADGSPGLVDESAARLVTRYCAAVQKVCTTWIEADPGRAGTQRHAWPTMPKFPGARAPHPSEALVAMRRFSTAQVVNHCEAMLAVACNVAVFLETRDSLLRVPPLISGSNEGAAWVRMRFRVNIERALMHVHSQGRLVGCAVLCALVCVPSKEGDPGLRCFARMLGTGQFVDVGTDSAASHTRLQHAVCTCALDFERALQQVQNLLPPESRLCMPEAHAACMATNLANMGRCHAPPLDRTTGVALAPLLSTLESGEGRAFSSAFSFGSAVAVLTAPSVGPYTAARAARAGVAGEGPSSLATPLAASALYRRLTAYGDSLQTAA